MGGKVFKIAGGKIATKPIKKQDIEPTITWLEKAINLPLRDNLAGSAGQKDESGDLDIIIDTKHIERSQLADRLFSAVKKTGYVEDKWVKITENSVHFCCPIMGDTKNGFVQVDFMFFDQPILAKFLFRQDSDTAYSCATRNTLMNSIAKSLGYKITPNQGITDRSTGKLISNDPDQISKMILNPNVSADDVGSVETILACLADDSERDKKLASFFEYAEKRGIKVNNFVTETEDTNVSFLARLRDRIVNKGMQVIIESAHIDHPEDLVFEYGSSGLKRALAAIKTVIQNPQNASIKWDGMPALIFGRMPNGEFVLTDKSAFHSKTYNGLATSPEHIREIMSNRRGDKTELINLYTNLFPILEKTVPNDFEGYIKGDLLFSSTPPVVNGSYVFTPNTVTYHVSANSDLGNRLKNSKVGIAVHTFIPYPGGESTPVTGDMLTSVDGVLILDPSLNESGGIAVDTTAIDNIEIILDERSEDIDRLFNPQELRTRKISNLPALMKQYINSRVRDGDFDNLVGKFPEWIREKEKFDKVRRIFDWLDENRYGLVSAMRSFAEITKVKNDIVKQLDAQTGDIKATIDGKLGHEGYVSDGLKFVNRMKFSAANFRKNANGVGQ